MEGGTDVAEMVLFSVDDCPPDAADNETLAALETNARAIRLPTGADGGYLLHLYVNESAPESLKQHCVVDDSKKCGFQTATGRIAFGGAESTFQQFKPKANIRSDGTIEPGVYNAVAYRTEYPDELIEDAVRAKIGLAGARAVEFPGSIILVTVVATIGALLAEFVIGVTAIGLAAAALVGGVVWFRSYTRSDKFKSFVAEKREVEYGYPSVLVEMTKRDESE